MFFFFFQEVFSTLKPGENPYKILGVNPKASKDEIKKAFHKITLNHHPDLHKNKKDEKIWMKANDAYEILSDEKRRRIYDQTGDVSEEHINNQGFHHTSTSSMFKTPEIQSQDLESELDSIDTHDLVIFLYSQFDFFFLSQYNQIYESIAEEFSTLMKFYHNDIRSPFSVYSAYSIPIRSSPAIVYVSKRCGHISFKICQDISNPVSIRQFLEQCMNSNIKKFKSINKLQSWIDSNSFYTRVISFDRPKNPPRRFQRLSGIFTSSKFAYISSDLIECVKYFNLTRFPTILIFSNNIRKETQSPKKILQKLNHIVLQKLTHTNFKHDCADIAILFVGDPKKLSESNKTFLRSINISSVYTDENSSVAKAMKLKNGQWAVFSSAQKKFKPMPQLKNNFTNIFDKGDKFEAEPDKNFEEKINSLKDSIWNLWENFSILKVIHFLLNQPFTLIIMALLFFITIPQLLFKNI